MEAMLIAGSLMYIVLAVLFAAMIWVLFEKAGRPGWAALIPLYNILVWIQIAGKPAWWILLLIIPFVNVIFSIWLLNSTAHIFGKGFGFTLGLIFLPFVFLPVLALGEASYQPPANAWKW